MYCGSPVKASCYFLDLIDGIIPNTNENKPSKHSLLFFLIFFTINHTFVYKCIMNHVQFCELWLKQNIIANKVFDQTKIVSPTRRL